jgi:Zn-dependent peptidase ImmA (M78 family)
MPSRDQTLEIAVEPKVLEWFIINSGWTPEGLAKKLKVAESTVDAWLAGNKKLTLTQLENLSKALKRPLAAFLLSKPPEEKPPPKDYRMIPGREGKFDRKTLLAIRRARRLQNVSKELFENLEHSYRAKVSPEKLSDDPKDAARRYRSAFQITAEMQKKWKTTYDAFKALRGMIEGDNIIVLQTSMPMEDARGFALVDELPAVIVINSKDQIEARLFSLMHEFAHVLLGESGVSMSEDKLSFERSDPVEKWCDTFASEFLLPQELAGSIFAENKQSLTETKILNTLSKKYKVSKKFLLYSMRKLDFISAKQFEDVLNRYKKELSKLEKRRTGGGGLTSDKRCLAEKGQKFVSLVLDNVEKGYITRSDALDYLSIKSGTLDKFFASEK